MIIHNIGEKSFGSMKDEHFWFLLEPTTRTVSPDGTPDNDFRLYWRIGPGYQERKDPEPKRTFLSRIFGFIHRLIHKQPELLPSHRFSCICSQDGEVPDWILEHFEKTKDIPGTFYFYEYHGELYLSLRPYGVSEEDLPYLKPCSYAAYSAIADTFGLQISPAIGRDDNLWVFDKLGKTFEDWEHLRTWMDVTYLETGYLVMLARA